MDLLIKKVFPLRTVSHGMDDYGVLNNDKFKMLFIMDGHNSRQGSKEFVKKFKQYLSSQNLSALADSEKLIKKWAYNHFQLFQQSVCREIPAAAMSFLLIIINQPKQLLHIFHVGDCRLGKINTPSQQLDWLTSTHTAERALSSNLSENELVSSPYNHILYKSFKAKRYENNISYQCLGIENVIYILVTDGFWKLPNNDEQQFILRNEECNNCYIDDVTCIGFDAATICFSP